MVRSAAAHVIQLAGLAFLARLVLYYVAGRAACAHPHMHFGLSLILGFDPKTSPHQGRSVQKVLCLSMECHTLKHLCLYAAYAPLAFVQQDESKDMQKAAGKKHVSKEHVKI